MVIMVMTVIRDLSLIGCLAIIAFLPLAMYIEYRLKKEFTLTLLGIANSLLALALLLVLFTAS